MTTTNKEAVKRARREISRLAKMSLMGGSGSAMVFHNRACELAKRYGLWAHLGIAFNFTQN